MRARDTKVGGKYRFVIEGTVEGVGNGSVTIDTTETGSWAFDWNLFNDVQELEPVQPKPAFWPPQAGDVWVSECTAYLVRQPGVHARLSFQVPGHSDVWRGDMDNFLTFHPDAHLIFRNGFTFT